MLFRSGRCLQKTFDPAAFIEAGLRDLRAKGKKYRLSAERELGVNLEGPSEELGKTTWRSEQKRELEALRDLRLAIGRTSGAVDLKWSEYQTAARNENLAWTVMAYKEWKCDVRELMELQELIKRGFGCDALAMRKAVTSLINPFRLVNYQM